jgi:hypothetical protein
MPPRFRARRGAMVLFIGVFFTAAIVLGALTFDFARLANLKAELRISADAGAHAGVARLIRSGSCNWNAMRSEAQTWATRNLAMQGSVTIVTNQPGDWNPSGSGSFSGLGSCPGVDALRMVVSRPSSGLFMSLVGVTPPTVQAEAIAYRCTSSFHANCSPTRPILVR